MKVIEVGNAWTTTITNSLDQTIIWQIKNKTFRRGSEFGIIEKSTYSQIAHEDVYS